MSRFQWKPAVGWLLVLIGGVIGFVALWPSPESVEPPPAEGPAGQAERSTDPDAPLPPPEMEARFLRLVGNMWWHQKTMRETLGLDDAQVETMDRLCLGFLRRRWQRRQADLEEQGAFVEALKELDLQRADRLLASREQRAAERAGAPDRLVLDVLKVLTPEQLRVAREQMPNLLEQPWLKGVSGSRKGRALERAKALREKSANRADHSRSR